MIVWAVSLVGLGLAGVLGESDWADLDQRKLAWGDMLPIDDAALFPTRGRCDAYPRMAKQWASESEGIPYHDISTYSCVNSWLGGNIAARPLDTARFVYATYADDAPNKLLSQC